MSYHHYPSLSSYFSTRIGLALMELGFILPHISLMRVNFNGGILYRCPLFLGQRWENLYTHFLSLHSSARLSKEGWLEFFVTETELITWLDYLPSLLTRYYPFEQAKTCSDEFFFLLQRAYARCYSLLSLGQREELIQLAEENQLANSWLWISPQTIPWQKGFKSSGGRKILLSVLRVMDEWDSTSPLILAQTLAQVVIDYQRYEFRWADDRETLQARLGLIAIVHWLLRSLLGTKLAVIPLNSL